MNKMLKSAAIFAICLITLLGAGSIAYADAMSSVWAFSGYEQFKSGLDLSVQTEDRSGNGWQWKAKERQLILSGAKFYFPDEGLTLPDGAEIVLNTGKRNVMIGEGIYGSNTVYGLGDITISGSGELNIYSDDDGLITEGDVILSGGTLNVYAAYDGMTVEGVCCIEAGSLSIDSSEAGLGCSNYVQQGGIVCINSYGTGLWSDSVVMEAGELQVESLDAGIYTEQLEMNGGLIELAAARMGIMMYEGDCIINDGVLKIKGYKSYDLMCGIDWLGSGQFIMHDGEVEITTCQCNNKEMIMNYALGSVVDAEALDKRRIVIDGGKMSLSGGQAIMITTNYYALENDESKVPLPEEIIQINTDRMDMDGLQVGKVKQTLNTKEGETWYRYTYGLTKDDQIVSNAVLTAKQSIEQSAGITRLYIDGREIALSSIGGKVYIDENGRTMMPLRALSEAMGCTTRWDAGDQSITITTEQGEMIIFYLDQKTYWVNGEQRQMDTTAISLPPGRAYVPLRFAVEGLGAQVEMTSEANGISNIMITARK